MSERFHAALTGVPRPDAIIDPRASPWAIGDRVAWGELPYDAHPQYLLRALIFRGVTSIEAGTDWRPTFELARRIAACASR